MLNHAHLPILRAARYLIDSGEMHFICFALQEAGSTGNRQDPELADDCCDFIHHGIKGHAYLTDWVRDELLTCSTEPAPWWLGPRATSCSHPRREEAVTQRCMMRLAWLDKIIWDIEHA